MALPCSVSTYHDVTQQKGNNKSKNSGSKRILNTNKKTPPITVKISKKTDNIKPTIKITGLNKMMTNQNKSFSANNINNMPTNASITYQSQ